LVGKKKQLIRKIVHPNPVRLSKPRITPLEGAQLTIEMEKLIDKTEWDRVVQPFIEETKKSNRGSVPNVWATLARHRDLLFRLYMIANYIYSHSTLPARDREMLILRTAWLRHSEYEWGQHVQIVKQCDLLSGDEINRIMEGPDAEGWNPSDATLIRSVDELHTDAFITEATWKALVKRYNTHQLMDLVFTVGQYHMAAMVLNTIGVQLEEGVKGFQE